MDALVKNLLGELKVETVFTIPIFGGIPISESIVVTWIMIAAVLLLSLLLTRNLKVDNPGKGQLALEGAVQWLWNFFKNTMQGEGQEYYYYLMSVMVYIGMANLIGIIGFKPPTKDINVTVALSLLSIILIQVSGWRKKGAKGYFKSYAKPIAIIAPLNVLELGIKPLSLCMRLFGNVLGSFVIMELLKQVLPVFLPVIFSLYFDVFDGLIQAYVFVFLTALFMCECMEDS
ncbi:MAG: F0F1 ATP synthase subunit A [Lachnospiraceae bacterium]|nr:F0F1 ATP synthase subunit A [Lachnospiraceae bacterium]MDD6667846.1 F0F1 ATP synthase subunit A [Lachnospiraceae bacterium]